ncbi:superfamily II DNA or RNA helicase [Rhodoglobus vestalii]|uniref:Superfamily II DNA or RNA helicase n=1 Tax=Rhodoglobus vestalii TaxID=193384 RepID=A0A8H2K7P1_9MICO|nr:DEAD/DEAH box helicase [Rhodoglobus vestalii]TQO20358.1 superfamily II DNA or RNA helicase [Rhodoglobus vestalii]
MNLNDLEPFGQDIDFGYVDRKVNSPRKFHPHLVLNTKTDSMLRALRHELQRASSFTFSVAFVPPRAIALLKQELIDFVGVGRIITSDYLGFNSPGAFAELLNLENLGIDVRIHKDTAFHPKGYVFRQPDGITAILGSSNLTESALASNHEWNLRVSAARESDLAEQFTNLLDEELFNSMPLTQKWIDDYADGYVPPTRNARVPSRTDAAEDELHTVGTITPNVMQVDALSAIATVRAAQKDRALVISATGTGKTILSALDVHAVNPQRLLFIAHREQILDRAITEFQRVLDAPRTDFGKITGNSREPDRRYVFATVQTLSQQHVLDSLHPEAFDYILIDEVHRAGAESFTRVLDHFHPEFLLGMTATPERTDGQNIFELFDYNVPYEIRLNSALELGMLAPFHYFGVADITFTEGVSTTAVTPLSQLVLAERVDHILKSIETYGQAGVSPRGLIFCSRKEEAHALSVALNLRSLRGSPLRTVALTGQDSIETRERVVDRLEAGDLDYVLTVDIFNEGVDIPSVNQVIMLRQTQSSIVFVQQLGRGLRKVAGKEYLVVIDFIGNYANNYLIPIALFGDDSLNKESLRKNLIAAEEKGVLAGLSSVRFDRIAQERVLRSLATVKLDSLQNLKTAIESVRNRVGHTPLLVDFLRFESVDPVVLATKVGNYPELLAKVKIAESELSSQQSRALTVVSKELLTAKRPHELLLLRQLLSDGHLNAAEASAVLAGAGRPSTDALVLAAMRSLTLKFNTASELKAFASDGPAIEDGEGAFRLSPVFANAYGQSPAFRTHLDDVIDTGLRIIADRYADEGPFTPGRQYSRKDASRLLNWRSNMYSTIYGYKVDSATATCPIFVTLHKSDEVSASTAYEDELLDTQTLLWYTRSRTSLATTDVTQIAENAVDIHVFSKKSDADGPGHYYLGRATARDAQETTMPGTDGKPLPVVRMRLHFDQPVQAGLFDYFHTNLTD